MLSDRSLATLIVSFDTLTRPKPYRLLFKSFKLDFVGTTGFDSFSSITGSARSIWVNMILFKLFFWFEPLLSEFIGRMWVNFFNRSSSLLRLLFGNDTLELLTDSSFFDLTSCSTSNEVADSKLIERDKLMLPYMDVASVVTVDVSSISNFLLLVEIVWT